MIREPHQLADKDEGTLLGRNNSRSDEVIELHIKTTNPTAEDDYDSGHHQGSVWLNTSTNRWWMCKDDSPGAAVWGSPAESAENLSSIDWCYAIISPNYGSTREYARVRGTTWVSLGGQVFAGSDSWIPSLFKAIANLETEGTGYIRLYDYTNGTTIADLTITETTVTIHTDNSLSNLPESEAIVRVIARTSDISVTMRIYSTHLWST